MSMSGSLYIYDAGSKRFVARPSAEPPRHRLEDMPDAPDEPRLHPPRVKPAPSLERQTRIVWRIFMGLFLIGLVLLTLWTLQKTSRRKIPLISSQSMPAKFPKENFLK